MREDFTDEHMAWCNGGQRKVYAVWKISSNTVDGYETDTKRIQNVHTAFTVDPHKAEERFRNGLVRKPYKRSLYERTFMSKP